MGRTNDFRWQFHAGPEGLGSDGPQGVATGLALEGNTVRREIPVALNWPVVLDGTLGNTGGGQAPVRITQWTVPFGFSFDMRFAVGAVDPETETLHLSDFSLELRSASLLPSCHLNAWIDATPSMVMDDYGVRMAGLTFTYRMVPSALRQPLFDQYGLFFVRGDGVTFASDNVANAFPEARPWGELREAPEETLRDKGKDPVVSKHGSRKGKQRIRRRGAAKEQVTDVGSSATQMRDWDQRHSATSDESASPTSDYPARSEKAASSDKPRTRKAKYEKPLGLGKKQVHNPSSTQGSGRSSYPSSMSATTSSTSGSTSGGSNPWALKDTPKLPDEFLQKLAEQEAAFEKRNRRRARTPAAKVFGSGTAATKQTTGDDPSDWDFSSSSSREGDTDPGEPDELVWEPDDNT